MLKRIHEMETLPRGYGIAWREAIPQCVVVCAPVGLHWLIGAVRAAWLWLRMTYAADERMAVFERGYALGKAHGRDLARLEAFDMEHAAYRKGREHEIAVLEAWVTSGAWKHLQ
jgi:hypothetical protein